METAKITKLDQKTGTDKKVHYIATLDNNLSGFYNADLTAKINVGDEVEYSVETKKNPKTGKDFNILTLKLVVYSSAPAKEEKKTITPNPALSPTVIFQERCKGIFTSMQITMDKLYVDKMDFDKIKEWFNLVKNEVIDAVDDVSQE